MVIINDLENKRSMKIKILILSDNLSGAQYNDECAYDYEDLKRIYDKKGGRPKKSMINSFQTE